MSRRILIVDDETLIRQGIQARLEYLGFEFEKIQEADDGLKALSVLQEEEIDIVITDIRMADMSGLDFIRRAKPLYPHIQFMILSGYAEFSYAEQAIQLGVSAYLLKPISNDELKKVMNTALKELEKREEQYRILKRGERILKENEQYLLERNLNALLHQLEPLEGEALSLKQSIEVYFTLQDRKLMTILINIDGDSYERDAYDYQDNQLIRFAIRNIFNESSIKSDKIIINNLSNSNQLFAILSNRCGVTLRAEAEQLLSILQGNLWNRMHISTSIGISSIKDYLFIKGTKEAKKAFQQRMIHGNGNMYFYDDIRLLDSMQLPTAQLHMLNQYIERLDIGNIQFIINTIFSDESIGKYNVNYIRMMWVRIIGIVLKSANSILEKEPEKVEQLVFDVEELVSISSIKQLREHLWTVIVDCLNLESNVDATAKNKMKLAVKYITEHYNEDIAINDLAERFTMSPNYFSSVFKKETGQTTLNYIKELRLKKAKEYLVGSEKSVVDIAKEVGYEDSQYFFKVFKKATGQTPMQYRKSCSKL